MTISKGKGLWFVVTIAVWGTLFAVPRATKAQGVTFEASPDRL
ncbi:MAG TPA: hypothetical protein VMT20_22300 [Terriglobia bacterium]|nr:hypothetical protein [Terriglobia bacterium]